MNNRTEAPEGASEWQPELSSEGQAHIDQLRPKVEARMQFFTQLREALGLDFAEYAKRLMVDESECAPKFFRADLAIDKLYDYLEERGGSLSLTITLDGLERKIPG